MSDKPTPQAIERLWWLCAELETLADSGDLDAEAARRLRVLVDRATEAGPPNVVIAAVVDAMRVLTSGDLDRTAAVLQAARPDLLTDREYAQVLGWLGHTRRSCARCSAPVQFVTDGPDPGWWRHGDIPQQPHAAIPQVTR